MTLTIALSLAGITGILGIAIGFILRWLIAMGKKGSMELEIKQMLLDAKEEAVKIAGDAEKKAEKLLSDSSREIKEKEGQLSKLEDRLLKKDESLEKRQSDVEKELELVKQKVQEVKVVKERLDSLAKEKESALERVAGLSKDDAKNILLADVEKRYEEDIMMRMQKLDRDAGERLDRKAKDILSTAVQRLASPVNNEILSSVVPITNDEIKGKVIGKEGRNIKAFERATGVDVIVDDTPGSIILSCFDPVRRAVAKSALENLIKDGRIQPAKIEEVVEKSKAEINKIIKEEGEKAAYEVGVFNLDPRIVSIVGRLHFRTSFGQNVLRHSIEMAHVSGMLAEELGGDVAIAKAGAFVHDIGKAVDHEIQGTHVEIGRRILQKFGADERIIQAMQSHHEEYPYETLESVIVQTADAISGGRPGARRDSVENYVKRLQDLEAIATAHAGVEKCYAIQAGREVRVFVTPEKVSDLQALELAREIAKQVEQDLKYPGEIRIAVIRETRVIEYAR
ncbi:MAG: ribonuclease Y [Candidatus Vogelbacteria bacterium CG10_big_fil_rev_8_21_14_0_10_45_14]|uniref:Ribonuclease Y n=1 Tax=Candidatus Vogelbacteria bacterium CG10_big_fil_rev_8_21_14_0_10_45_14 TaxID=1975042 RepID=A0A2H0RLU5_9BACT|nr:MAG: ribonuclease Y [Candidatus Vogelbacteria bacterium CG10_big_fil_rev_8_21_14_0_10_45_14]